MPLALGGIDGIGADGDAGQGVAVHIGKFSRQQAGHGCAGRVGGVFGDGRQRRQVAGCSAHRRIGYRRDGDGNGSGRGLCCATRVAQVAGGDSDGVGSGTGAVGIVVVRRITHFGTRQCGIDGVQRALHRHGVTGVGTGRYRQPCQIGKRDVAVRCAESGLHHATPGIRVSQGDVRRQCQRCVFGNGLRPRHRNRRRQVDAGNRDGGGTGVADFGRRIDGLESKCGTTDVVGGRDECQAGRLCEGQRSAGSEGGAALLEQARCRVRNCHHLVAGDGSIGGVAGTAVGIAGVTGQVDPGQRAVLVDRQRKVGRNRRVVHGCDVDGQGIRRRIEYYAAVAGAAVVLHLKRQAGVSGATAVGGRGVDQVAVGDVGRAHRLPGGD